MTTSANMLSLAALGNVPASYVHESRAAVALDPLVVPGAIFKWYHVHRVGEAIPPELDARARETLRATAAAGWNLSYGLNFALMHLSTAQGFLIAGVWRAHQEMWERIYIWDRARPDAFIAVEPDGLEIPCACVWELGVICHERQAWQRYLFSPRAEADKRAWLADVYSGPV